MIHLDKVKTPFKAISQISLPAVSLRPFRFPSAGACMHLQMGQYKLGTTKEGAPLSDVTAT